MWVTYAHRPLRIHELRHALAVRTSERYFDNDNLPSLRSILKCCSGLILLDHQSLEVRLVHFTLQHYVQSQARSLFPDAEIAISQTCLTYMLFEVDMNEQVSASAKQRFSGFKSSSASTFEHFPFLDYAVTHWGDHVKGCTHQAVGDLAMLFLMDTARLRFLMNKGTTGLHVAAEFGLPNNYVAMLLKVHLVDCRDEEDETLSTWRLCIIVRRQH